MGIGVLKYGYLEQRTFCNIGNIILIYYEGNLGSYEHPQRLLNTNSVFRCLKCYLVFNRDYFLCLILCTSAWWRWMIWKQSTVPVPCRSKCSPVRSRKVMALVSTALTGSDGPRAGEGPWSLWAVASRKVNRSCWRERMEI